MTMSGQQEFRLREVSVVPGEATLVAAGQRRVLRVSSMRVLLTLAEHAPDFVTTDELSRLVRHHDVDGSDELAASLDELRDALGDLFESDPSQGHRLTVEPELDGMRLFETDSGPISVQPLGGIDKGDYLLQTRDGPVRLHPMADEDKDMLGRWFDELKRRRVFRAITAYAVIAWLILQIVDVLTGALPVPDWTLTATVIVLAAGFPLIAILSWYYQVELEKPAPGKAAHGIAEADRIRLIHHIDIVIIVFLLGIVAFLSWDRILPFLNPDDRVTVAVLPLDNLSDDPSNSYLGEGIADDIRSRLDEIPQLLLAPRRSSRALARQDLDIRAIGERLGVDHVVEGTLRRDGDSIRVNVQLIDVDSGFSSWQKIYDANLDQMLPLQNRISLVLASELHVALTAEMRSLLARQVTDDPAAYDLYLRANSYLDLPKTSENLAQAHVLFQEAVARDASFALGYAGLCRTNIERFQHTSDTTYVDLAKADCNRALALDDDLSLVHTALGELHLLGGELDEAERSFRNAIERDESAIDAYSGLGEVYAKRSEPEQAEEYFNKAIAERPGNWNGLNNYARFLIRQGRLDDAIEAYRRLLELVPDNAHSYNNLGVIYYMQGRFDAAADSYRKSLELDPGRAAYSNTGTMYYYAGDYAEAVSMFRRAAEEARTDYRLWGNLADAQRFVDTADEDAGASYRRAIELANQQLAVNPSDSETLTNVAWYRANLGEATEALEALSAAGSASAEDPTQQYIAALVYVLLGDLDRAQAALEKARSLGFPGTIIEATPEFEGTLPLGE